MAASSASLHEHEEKIGKDTIDRHRAIVSIMEELEAVDWYDQRSKATDDEELKKILEHNRDEEKEHAMMALEWLRRHDEKLNEHMNTYLFTEGSVLDIEKADTAGGGGSAKGGSDKGGSAQKTHDGSLHIGSLKGAK